MNVNYMHAHVCTFVHMHACSCDRSVYACMLVACFYKMFPHIHYFRTTKHDSSRQQKMSNMTNEKKDFKQLTDINHSFTFNSNVSNIGDDYSFNKETLKSGLKRKREHENIVGTTKVKRG